MSAEMFTGMNVVELARMLRHTVAEIASTESTIATMEAINIEAGSTALTSQNAARLSTLRTELQGLKNTQTAIEAVQKTRTALTVTQATEAAVVEGAAETGVVARLGSIGRLLGYTGRAATMAGGATATVGLAAAGLLTYFIACGLGSLAADGSVQVDSNGKYRANREEAEVRQGRETVRDQEKAWQIVKVPNMGGFGGKGIYSIRTLEDIKRGIAYADFRHGGMSGDPIPTLETVGPPQTREKAAAQLASMIVGGLRKPPLAGGLWGTVNGELCTIDDYGPVAVSEIQRHLK